MNDDDKLVNVKKLWEWYNKVNAEVQKQLNVYLTQQAEFSKSERGRDWVQIAEKALHDVEIGSCNGDLPIMVRDYNAKYGESYTVADIIAGAEIWVLEESLEGEKA